jgi:putative ABC transport system ATP-binding protein
MPADEITTNFDARRGQEVAQLLRQKALRMNKALVTVSHDDRIREVTERVFWVQDGLLRPES